MTLREYMASHPLLKVSCLGRISKQLRLSCSEDRGLTRQILGLIVREHFLRHSCTNSGRATVRDACKGPHSW